MHDIGLQLFQEFAEFMDGAKYQRAFLADIALIMLAAFGFALGLQTATGGYDDGSMAALHQCTRGFQSTAFDAATVQCR